MTSSIPSYCTVPLTKGRVALVDESDFPFVSRHKWYAVYSRKTNSFYAARDEMRSGKRKHIYMHRAILGLNTGDKRQADHKVSGETLDNRRSNLRIASPSENARNQRLMKNNKSGAKGVCYKKRRQVWEANICIDRKQIFLGEFRDFEQAKEAYARAALAYHGEFSNLG